MKLASLDYVTISIQALLVIVYICGRIPADLLFKSSAMFWSGYIISMCVSRLIAMRAKSERHTEI